MSFGQFFGKIFICVILVLSGISKLQDPVEISQYTVNKTDSFYKLVSSQPELKPYTQYIKFNDVIKHNPEILIQCIGLLEILVALSLLMNVRYFGLTFAAALVPITLIMHNPLTVPKTQYFNELLQCIKNLGFIGATIMMSVPSFKADKVIKKIDVADIKKTKVADVKKIVKQQEKAKHDQETSNQKTKEQNKKATTKVVETNGKKKH